VGAGKTIIAAAYIARAAAAGAGTGPGAGGGGTGAAGATLVLCPEQIVAQWLAALRDFAPKLRCRRVDQSQSDQPMDAATVADCTPIGSLRDWDVIVASYDDVPTFTVTGGGGSSTSSAAGAHLRHPLWDYHRAGEGEVEQKEGEKREEEEERGVRWHRVFFDEPQDLDFTWKVGAECGAGVWLTTRLRATHRWGLTATPGGGDKLQHIASLLFGQRLSRLAGLALQDAPFHTSRSIQTVSRKPFHTNRP
jgi:hypothetical protein